MQCKQCSTDLTGKDYKMVAEWPFCPDCFEQLLTKPAESSKPESKAERKTDRVVEYKQAEITKCHICNKEIVSDQYKKVGIWVFCPDCHLDLTPRPKPPPRPEPEEDTDAEVDAVEQARMRQKIIQRVSCAGCGKSIPEGGSKYVDAEPYCPECWYALPEEVRQTAEPVQAETVEQQAPPPSGLPDANADPGCESCGRQLSQDSLQTVEGYAICQACLSADAELAVHIARGRHQKRLQRIKESQDI